MELLLASLTGRLANDGELSKDDGLQGLLCRAARLRLKLTLLIALDVLITLGVATRKKNNINVQSCHCKTVVQQLHVKIKNENIRGAWGQGGGEGDYTKLEF